MKLAVLLIFMVFFSRACDSAEKSRTKNALMDSTISPADTSITDSMHLQQAEYILRNKIQGLWTDEQQTNAPVFDVKPDSIYYVDHFRSYRYQLRGDSVFIYYPDWTYSGKVRVTRDTMIIESETGESRFTRFTK